jgi:hypothetical protein
MTAAISRASPGSETEARQVARPEHEGARRPYRAFRVRLEPLLVHAIMEQSLQM